MGGMQPVLVDLGPLTLYSYGVFIALGFATAGLIGYRLVKRAGLSPSLFIDYFLYAAVAGLLGARLWHLLFRPQEVDSLWQVFSLWGGGLALHGGLLLALTVLVVVMRRQGQPVWRWLDLLAIGGLAGLAVGKLGSFLNGDSFGRSSDLPWAVQFNDPLAPASIMGAPIHPLQLYAAVLYAAIAAGLYYLYRRRGQSVRGGRRIPSAPGFVFWTGLLSLSLAQFLLEFLHAPIDSLYWGDSIKVVSWLAAGLAVVAMLRLRTLVRPGAR